MRERRLAGPHAWAAPDQGLRGDGVVRRPEGRPIHCLAISEEACGRVDSRHLEHFVVRERREDPRQGSRKHRLTRARRPIEHEIVSPSSSYFKRTLRALLPFHLRDIDHRRRA